MGQNLIILVQCDLISLGTIRIRSSEISYKDENLVGEASEVLGYKNYQTLQYALEKYNIEL